MIHDHEGAHMTLSAVPAGEFKARCLQLLDDVASTGEALVITKRGRPVARLVPMPRAEPPSSLFGALKGRVLSQGDLISPIDEVWDAEA
jgi:prevent-host-death family protein